MVNSEGYENLVKLCDDYGSRFFATPEEKAAAEFLASKLKEYGLVNVKVEPYTLWGYRDGKPMNLWSWERGTATLTIRSPTNRRIECVSLANSPSTTKYGITAEGFFLESGSKEYIINHKDEIKGKLVLDGKYRLGKPYLGARDTENLHHHSLYAYLVKYGAIGVVYASPVYGNLAKTGFCGGGLIGKIPACGISLEDFHYMLRHAEKGKVTINLQIENTYKPNATAYNVMAELPGYKYPKKIILVGGHFDGHDLSPGAMDDAAGTCVLLEAARALAKHAKSFKRTIRFVCFSGEELGMNGATGYVLNHANELEHINLMINTDASGISTQAGHSFKVCGPKELIPYLEATVNHLGSFNRTHEVPTVSQHIIHTYSDDWPFFVSGVPTAHLLDIPMDPRDLHYCHSRADTVDKVDSKAIKDSAIILALTLMHIANEEKLPFKYTLKEEIDHFLEEKGMTETIKIEQIWHRESKK